MKRFLSLILGIIGIMGVGIAQPTPPDVYLQWIQQEIPLLNNPTQDITFPMPQVGISKYTYHYLYLFFDGPCTVANIDPSTTGNLIGTVAGGLDGVSSFPIGGLLMSNTTTVDNIGSTNPILLYKGNGVVSSISANLHLVASTGADLSVCTINALYKATIREEEGVNAVGGFAQSGTMITNIAINPVVTTAYTGAMTIYTYAVPTPGTSYNGSRFAISDIIACTLPIVSSGAFRALTPVSLTLGIGAKPLGVYTILNSCITIAGGSINLGIMAPTDTLTVAFSFPTAAGYAQKGELVTNVFGTAIY